MCDIVEHLKEQSQPFWSAMQAVMANLHDADAHVRQACAYCINMAAPLQMFGEMAPLAFDGILKVVAQTDAKKKKKKKDLEAANAYENFVSALLSLLRHQKQHCKDPAAAWTLLLSKLPLKND